MIKNPKHALTFIFITLLIDVIGIGIIIPVVPKLIEELIHGNVSDASVYGGWLAFAYAAMQFLFAPVLGNLSDSFGRRPVLLLSLLGLGVDYLLTALAPTIAWLFIGRFIAGIAGASFTTASAYIVDISTPGKRTQNLGLIGAAFGLGFIIGPVIGGMLGQFGPRVPFYAAAGLSLLNAGYGYLVLPETLPVPARRRFEWKRANPFGAMKSLKRYGHIGGLFAGIFLIQTGMHAVETVWAYFTIEQFAWTELQVGYSLGFVGILVAVVQGGLIRIVNPRLGYTRSIFLGILLHTTGMFLFAFATEGWMMYAFVIPYALGGISNPAIQSLVSGQASPGEHGEMQGIITAVVSLTAIVGPPVMANLFAFSTMPGTSFYFPGAPFILGGVMISSSIFFIYPVLKKAANLKDR